ncbi:hypothetical protein ACFVVP_39210 [Streptomyces sp. NPDC058128]|uniref:hypothetical protein n=1 Tax=Streptomyces sp. NPDC058128 TaxID=3346352 RepID=UPI0036E4414B
MDGRDALRAAAHVGGTALKLKVGGITFLVFVLFLVLLGVLTGGMSGEAAADSCGRRGTPGIDLDDNDDGAGGSQGTVTPTRKEQIERAKTIDKAAADGGLSGFATLIGLMTALQEPTLINLDYGDRDSVGLFQQRPSQGVGIS